MKKTIPLCLLLGCLFFGRYLCDAVDTKINYICSDDICIHKKQINKKVYNSDEFLKIKINL